VLSNGLHFGQLKVRSFTHKGLNRLYEEGIAKGVPPHAADKLRRTLAFLDDMQDPEDLRSLPVWKVHARTGDRKGTWKLSVTRNRRLTSCIDSAADEICDLNWEDCHRDERKERHADEEPAPSRTVHSG